MMPWEHVCVGYIGYSFFAHVVYRTSPASDGTRMVVLASLLPDLIDKPLAWEFGVFASGYAIAHSIFFALPVSIAVGSLASSRGPPRVGWAFAVGYHLHLLADIVSKYLIDGEIRLDRILWPIRRGGDGYETGLVGEFTINLVEYLHWVSRQAASRDPDPYLFFILGVGIIGIALWVYDGVPVGREIYRAVRRADQTASRSVDERRSGT